MSAVQRGVMRRGAAAAPGLVAGAGVGALLAALAGVTGSPPVGTLGPALVVAAPFALAALVGVAKSSTP